MRRRPEQLDLKLSLARKKRGMAAAAANNAWWLYTFRRIAERLARKSGGVCHADMVHDECLRLGHDFPKGPLWGSIFKARRWEATGDRIRSAQPKNHGRELHIWKLKEEV